MDASKPEEIPKKILFRLAFSPRRVYLVNNIPIHNCSDIKRT